MRPDDDEEDSDRLRIDHIDGDLNSIGQLAHSIQALAYQRRLEKVNAGLLDYEPLLRTMLQAGYQPHEQFFGLWVMELQL